MNNLQEKYTFPQFKIVCACGTVMPTQKRTRTINDRSIVELVSKNVSGMSVSIIECPNCPRKAYFLRVNRECQVCYNLCEKIGEINKKDKTKAFCCSCYQHNFDENFSEDKWCPQCQKTQ